MAKKKTHEEFVEEMKQVNPNITILDKYIDSETHLTCKCNECGNIWKSMPLNLLKGRGCNNYRNHNNYISPRYKDYTGCRFGMLMVLERIKTDKNTSYRCMCDCGNETIVEAGKLASGHTKSCGCLRFQLGSKKIHDLTGKKFGKLNVISQAKKEKSNGTFWNCICDCGEIIIVSGSKLSSGKTKSCGCLRSSGELSVINYLNNKNIPFEYNKKFDALLSSKGFHLSYDFYLPQYNILCEIQGIQHEAPVNYFGGEKQFEKQQEHDKRKREYAENNGYKLLEIWYYDFNNIEMILNKELGVG